MIRPPVCENISRVHSSDRRDKDYVIWDDELLGFGLRVFTSGKRSYLIQYRSAGRSRRYTIGQHGVWTPELARKEAKVQLGRVAQGDNEERQLDHKAITVKELCDLYLNDLKAGLILGKGGRPKKATTIVTDTGRIHRHILPLIGTRRVKDLVKADINKDLKDIMAGKTRVSVKTKKLLGKAICAGRSWYRHADRRSARRYPYLCRGGRNHSDKPSTRDSKAEGQGPQPALHRARREAAASGPSGGARPRRDRRLAGDCG